MQRIPVETVVLLHIYQPLLACFRAECAADEKRLAAVMSRELTEPQLAALGQAHP